MKKRIYKKWLKNPLNKRLVWKFCKPFPKNPPVAYVNFGKSNGEELRKELERLVNRIYEESMVPETKFEKKQKAQPQ